MNIADIRNELLKINPKARVNYAKHHFESEIRNYYNNSNYNLALLCRCLVDKVLPNNLPVSYCGNEPEYNKSILKSTCKNFSLIKTKNKCRTCYEKYFENKNALNKAGCLEKYGVDNPMKDPEIQMKLKSIFQEKYNTESPLASKEVQEQIQKTRNKQKIQARTDINYVDGKCIPLDEICDFLCSIGIQYERNVRILDKKEIDIYIPEFNIGIEHNGLYWHSTKFIDKNYHQNKKLLALSKGINLIFIYEDEWNTKQELIKNRLLNIFNKSKRIYARKCKVLSISNKESTDFLNKYHIQGSINSSINIGLFLENELYAVMTFGKSRFNKKFQYELYRYCSKGTVVGGASKLLKYFESTYHPESLLTYADMDWSSGNLYDKLGFEFDSYTSPNFFYYDTKLHIRYSRMQCQKKKLMKKYNFSPDMTAAEMISTLPYFTIYNSGSMIYFKKYK